MNGVDYDRKIGSLIFNRDKFPSPNNEQTEIVKCKIIKIVENYKYSEKDVYKVLKRLGEFYSWHL